MAENKYMAVLDDVKDEDSYVGMVVDKSNGRPVLTLRSKSETVAAVALSASLTLFERSAELKQRVKDSTDFKVDKSKVIH